MPTRKSSKPAAPTGAAAGPADPPAAPAAEPADAPAAGPNGAPEADGTTEADDTAEAAPMNRAERRARGRAGTGVPANRVNLPGKGGGFQAPRQWTKRRSG
jgi:hypothetical protein